MFDTPELAVFRAKVRQFVQQQLPTDLRATVRAGRQLSAAQYRAWHAILAAQGWLVPHWPQRWGGQGWSVAQQMVFDEEMAAGDAPELNAITFNMIGPVLMRFGDAAQQEVFLPAIASGQQWWCQGYSEPGAGSDLAALTTKARRDGDHYVVNGSKIWTSGAQHADWMFCLVRTDNSARQQDGISFLLIDMKSPGITVRPIVGIHGWSVFNEVFFDEVRVPVPLLVGQENRGWTVAKSLLEFERLKLARIGENKRRMARACAAAMSRREAGVRVVDRPWFRRRYAELQTRLMALEAKATHFVERGQAGETLGAEVSMLKLRGSRLIQLWEELIVDAIGLDALLLDPAALTLGPGNAQGGTADGDRALTATASSRRFLARGYTIAGGSSEVQHNILAKQVLGL